MTGKMGRSGNRSKAAAPQSDYPAQDGYITTLHPEGSFNNIRHDVQTRELIRPCINYRMIAFNILMPLLVFFSVCRWNVLYACIGLGLYLLIRLRDIIVCFIRLYQRYASDDIRLSCVFEPSCSEYMILSINKYGIFSGAVKGVMRLRRCHLPNGGVDYP